MAKRTEWNDCWVWTGAINPNGYAQTTVAHRKAYVHRAAYEAIKGPIPPGLHIDHLCRNRACFNPDHLEPVTPGENIRRGQAPTAIVLRTGRCYRGHADWQILGNGRRQCRPCAIEHSKRAYAELAARRREGRIGRTCPHCATAIPLDRRGNAVYCSLACKRAADNRRRTDLRRRHGRRD